MQLFLSDNTNLSNALPTVNLKIYNNNPLTLNRRKRENGIVSAQPTSNNKMEDILAQPWSFVVLNSQKVTDIDLVVVYEGDIEWT